MHVFSGDVEALGQFFIPRTTNKGLQLIVNLVDLKCFIFQVRSLKWTVMDDGFCL